MQSDKHQPATAKLLSANEQTTGCTYDGHQVSKGQSSQAFIKSLATLEMFSFKVKTRHTPEFTQ